MSDHEPDRGRDREPSPLTGSPYSGYVGPSGFRQLDGGYPVEPDHRAWPSLPHLDDEDHNGQDLQGDHDVQGVPGPALPTAGRLWHNPAAPPRADDDFWDDDDTEGPDGPERAHLPWRLIAGAAAVVAVAAGAILWGVTRPDSPAAPTAAAPTAASPTSTARGSVNFSVTTRPRPTATSAATPSSTASPSAPDPSGDRDRSPQEPPVSPTERPSRGGEEPEVMPTTGPELPPVDPCGPGSGIEPLTGQCAPQEPPTN